MSLSLSHHCSYYSPSSPLALTRIAQEIASSALVLGDVVVLAAGNAVPADLRLLEATKLEMDESALTGESVHVRKRAVEMHGSSMVTPLGDRINMAYSGCFVSQGRGRGVVVATGSRTELGHIARGVTDNEKAPSHLSREIRYMSIVLFTLGIVFGVVVFAANRYVYLSFC